MKSDKTFKRRIWLVTDTHLGHKRLLDWGRPEDFETKILDSLKVLRSGDTLIHLGDICIGRDSHWHEELMKRIPQGVKKILVRGNHDNKSYHWYYEHGWDFVCEVFTMRYRHQQLLFSHIPTVRELSKLTPYFSPDRHIHGHLHGNNHRDGEMNSVYDYDYYYDCAPDIHDYKPVLLDSILNPKNKEASTSC